MKKNVQSKDVALKMDNIIKVYVIQDRLSGVYSEPIFKINVEVMKRYFYRIAEASPESRPIDYDLYQIGEYDCKRAILYAFAEKDFVCNGKDVMDEFEMGVKSDGK